LIDARRQGGAMAEAVIDFFFYGTLVDADVRRLVLGREVPDEAVRHAELADFRRYTVEGQPFPAAVPHAGSTVDGVVLPGVGARDAAILSCFEGADYVAQPLPVSVLGDEGSARIAWVYVASDRIPLGEPRWSIAKWRTQHKPAFIEIATSWLDSIAAADIDVAEQAWRTRLR
jgi:hypothetical protein